MKNAPCVARRLGATFCDGPPSAASSMASKKLSDRMKAQRLLRGAGLPEGFTPTGWSLPGEGLPQIGGSIFGCPLMVTIDGEEVPVRCPKCDVPIVFDLSTLLTMGASVVQPEKRDALQESLAKGKMLCLMCRAYELAASQAGVMRDKKGRVVEFEGLEIWTVRWGTKLDSWTYAGPPGELLATLKALREELVGREIDVLAMPAGATSWEQRYVL